jgi:peptide/nickel transport system permease protein
MQELSHNQHLDPTLEDTPLFGAEVDVSPGEVMSLGVLSEGHEAGYVRPKKKGRVTFWIAATWIGVIVFLAVFADFLPFVDSYSAGSVLDGKQPPSLDHWMGTDSNGRDIFSRFVYGARVSLAIGIASLVFGLTIGGFLGLIAGYHRRRTDTFITTVMDILLAFPALVLALMLVTFGQAPDGGDRHFELGPISFTLSRLWLVILALSVLSIPPLTRVVRASTLTFANREFVVASRALGAKNGRVIGREILPNVVPPMLSFALTALAVLIVAEGALAFLGLSVRPPTPTWGFMIFEGKNPLQSGEWWISLMPALFMFLTILAINMLGDVARQRFDIKESVG